MSTIVKVVKGESKQFKVLCKGAPETIKTLLKEVPSYYDQVY